MPQPRKADNTTPTEPTPNGSAAGRLEAELRTDGLGMIADMVAWAAGGGFIQTAADLNQLAKLADWCRDKQAAREADTCIPSKELAALLDVSLHAITRWVRDGLPKTSQGHPVKPTLAWLGQFRPRALAAEQRLQRHRADSAEHKALKTQRLAMEVAEEKKRLHDATDCRLRQTQKALRVRTALARMGKNLRARGASDDVAEWVDAEHKRICDEFAGG